MVSFYYTTGLSLSKGRKGPGYLTELSVSCKIEWSIENSYTYRFFYEEKECSATNGKHKRERTTSSEEEKQKRSYLLRDNSF